MSEDTRTVENKDPGLLLVKGQSGENKDYVKGLAHAIKIVVSKHGYANLKCVGASAVNNAMKAATIAQLEAKTKGTAALSLESDFSNASFDSVDKSGLMITVKAKGE